MKRLDAQLFLAAMERDFVVKSAWPVFRQAPNRGAHVCAVEQRRSDLVDHRISTADASLQVCSHDFLAGCEGERRTSG